MHQSSFDKMAAFRHNYLAGKEKKSLKILDLGSFDVNGSYRPIFDAPLWKYQGIDMAEGPNVDIVMKNPYDWKEITSNSVDVLISGQAFEHIEYIWITMLEIARILKPGGLCCIIAPSAGPEHKYPLDCWRFYPDGFNALARFARLAVLENKTQWEAKPQYTSDTSNDWQDSFMVCKKPRLSPYYAFRRHLRLVVLRALLTFKL